MVQFNLHWQIEREGPAQVGDRGSSLKVHCKIEHRFPIRSWSINFFECNRTQL